MGVVNLQKIVEKMDLKNLTILDGGHARRAVCAA